MTGIMTGKWERVRLGDVCDIAAGQGAPQGDENYCKIGGTPFIKAGNLECLVNGVSLKSIQAVGDEIAHSHKLRLYPKGTIVFAKSGMSCVKEYVYELEDDCYVVNHLACILPNKMDATYIKYYFRATPPSRLIKDFGYPSIRLTDIANIILSVPDVKTQKRIADVLDKASELIKKRKEQIRLMDELAKSLFIEMFGDPVENPMGWERRLFVDIFSVIYRYPTFYGLEYVPDGFPVVRIGNIPEDGQIFYSSQNYVKITKEDNAKYPRTQLQLYDILMAVRGDGSTAKKIGVVRDPHLIFANISANLILLRENKSIANYSYLFSMLTSKAGQKILDKYVTKTAKKTITSNDLKRISFPLPPLSLQNEFADRIDAIEKQKALLQDGLAKMETAYKALMQEYFG